MKRTDNIVWLPYKKGEPVQNWYVFTTKEECEIFLKEKERWDCWKGFKPAKYKLTKLRAVKRT